MKPTSPAAIPNAKPTKVTKPTPDLQEQIRRRAHELYEQRGKDDGHELDDWLASGVGTQSAEGEGCHRIESYWGKIRSRPRLNGVTGRCREQPQRVCSVECTA